MILLENERNFDVLKAFLKKKESDDFSTITPEKYGQKCPNFD